MKMTDFYNKLLNYGKKFRNCMNIDEFIAVQKDKY